MVAAINGIVGAVLTYFVGTRVLGMSVSTCVQAVLMANLASLVSLPLTLLAQRSALLKPLLRGWFPSWVLISTLWFGVIWAGSPELRDVHRLSLMFMPLLLSTGFFVLSYGRFHDWVIAGAQLRARARASQSRKDPSLQSL